MVPSSSFDWTDDPERWAGVSSFGIGGTNVHVVLSCAPAADPQQSEERRPRIFPVSARTPSALNTACHQLSEWLAAETSASAAEVAATLQHGRRAFAFRRAVVAESCAEAADLLKAGKKGELPTDLAQDVVFLFPGQGQQFPSMAEALYREDAPFRRTIDRGCAILQEHTGQDFRPFLMASEQSPEAVERLRSTQIGQPILFLVEFALAERWRSLGVEPAALLGHSLGELTAASVAGVFSFDDGLRLAAERGRLMAQTAPGLMLAVMLPADKLAPLLDTGLWLAAENGPRMSVASGLIHAVEALERRLAAEGIATVRLASKNAFHTPLMAEAAKSFERLVAATARHAPNIPWLSNVTGTWIESEQAQDPRYWANQILSPVRFTGNLAALAERRRLLVEVGPGDALLGIARQQLATSVLAPSLGTEKRPVSDATIFRQAVALAWQSGVDIRWENLDPELAARRVPLPTYPFERQRCWIQAVPAAIQKAAAPVSPFPADAADGNLSARRDDIATWFYAPCWQSTPPAGIALQRSKQAPRCWLLLAGADDPLGNTLASALRAQRLQVVCVNAGERFTWQDGNATVNPASAADFEMLWKRIDTAELQPGGLIFLPGLDGRTVSGYDTILHTLQAAGARRRNLRKFEFITTAAESLNGEPVTNPEAGELHGLARAISAEFPGTACRCIDVENPESDTQPLVQQLLDELETHGAGLTVAYRRGTRWQKGWTPAHLKECSESPFRRGGVYLITGGTGGIGYVLARHLLRDHAARVVLTGRGALPDRSEWENWIGLHGEADATSRRILRMQELENVGGEVLYLTADVSDSDAMRTVLETSQQRFGPLNGVVHAAGIGNVRRIAFQSAEEAREIRRPKLQGSRVLAELLQGSTVDFLLLCSSISAIDPAPSQSVYAAANAFQNSFAAYCRGVLGIPATAIDFDAWREVGMLADAAVPEGMESYYDENMRRAMTTAEGIEVIRRVLGRWRAPQILTSTVALDPLAGRTPADAPESLQLGDEGAARGEPRELAAVLEIWKDLLGTDSVDPSDNFFSLGGHSLMGTMMVARIRERLGVSLSLRQIFEAQTPAALAELVRLASEKAESESARESLAEDEEREVFEI